MNETTESQLAFSGFSAVGEDAPFDRVRPVATIKVRVRLTEGIQNYDRGFVPNGPITASECVGDLFDVEFVPIAQSHLRITVLPVLAEDIIE